LLKTEIAIVNFIARQRGNCAGKIVNGERAVKDQKMDDRTDEEIDREGMAGEIAFCKLANIYPDYSISIRRGGIDCVFNGMTIDVKTTRYRYGKLLATKNKHVSYVDVFVLMIGEIPYFEFAGWLYSDELLAEENIRNLGHGYGYAVDQHNLRDEL
jgi:hypothetical protein